VRLRTPRGSALVRARLSPGIRRDTVFVPFHWGGESRVNVLVSDALDPISRMPEFKTCPVAVEPAAMPDDHPAQQSAAHLPA
jgi:assimilatory nitrate reductase catalytic subunit